MDNFTSRNRHVLEGAWHLDIAHSWVGISFRYAGVTKIQACFHEVEATAIFDEDGAGMLDAQIRAASCDTRSTLLNEEIHEQSFLWVDRFPMIRLQGAFNGSHLHGKLQLRGVQQNITFEITELHHAVDDTGEPRLGAEAHAQILRQDFGMNLNNSLRNGMMIISPTVELHVYASFQQSNVAQHTRAPQPVLYRHTPLGREPFL